MYSSTVSQATQSKTEKQSNKGRESATENLKIKCERQEERKGRREGEGLEESPR